jgi:hypothetical protein
MSRETQMTDDELTAFIERVVDEKLRERNRKMRAALAQGITRGLDDVIVTFDAAKLRKFNRGA